MLDFICELILEIILEGVFAVTVENPKVKTRIKTAVFVVVSQLFTLLLVWITANAWSTNRDGAVICSILALVWAIAMVIAAVHGHKRDWKQT